jgi:hypothetical protein
LRDDLKDEVIHVHGDIADSRRDIDSLQQAIGDLKELRGSGTRPTDIEASTSLDIRTRPDSGSTIHSVCKFGPNEQRHLLRLEEEEADVKGLHSSHLNCPLEHDIRCLKHEVRLLKATFSSLP